MIETQTAPPIPIARRPHDEEIAPPVSPAPDTDERPAPDAEDQATNTVETTVEPQRNPFIQWRQMAARNRAARKERGNGKQAFARWMNEQPTSFRDHLDYYLHQKDTMADGSPGWAINTTSEAFNAIYAVVYFTLGVVVGSLFTAIGYTLAWWGQRPGRATLMITGMAIVFINLATWL